MPPCAATVWERVGKTFEIQAVFSPDCPERGEYAPIDT